MKKLLCLLALLPLAAWAQPRSERLLEKGWLFTRGDAPEFARNDCDDSDWQPVTVPDALHRWDSARGGTCRRLAGGAEDGQPPAGEAAGREGRPHYGGPGWYRLPVGVPALRRGGRCTLLFDGAMRHARVYVNGHEAIYWPNGYNAFHVDITPFVRPDGENLLAVRLENMPESSRWYPGAGLLRNVHLLTTGDAYVPVWGTRITTPVISESHARVCQQTEVMLPEGRTLADYTLTTELRNAVGEVVASARTDGTRYDQGFIEQEFIVEHPALWTPETPSLYTSVTRLYEGDRLCDEYTTRFGIRTVEAVPGKGFLLNGEPLKFRGVCNHHDLGPLGGIANEAGIRRQIRLLKEMGCNAIRTSHNMPAPELVAACDEMGMMVMAESFDEWKAPKVENGYHLYFDEWVERDLVNLIRHFRNSPSVVMWCIGNEVPDQWNGDRGPKLTLQLRDTGTRNNRNAPEPTSIDAPDSGRNNNMAAVVDVPGFNYRPHKYPENYAKLPQRMILGSETASTLSSRGVYKFPVVRRSMHRYDDHQASSYDVEHCGWSNLPEDDFIQHDDLPYCMGEFVWTGFDYLGEPTPYYSDWPSHSSLFGIIDLAGLPKDRYWLYRSHWNPDAETLHILPHWNWPGREGEVTPVFVYTNYPSAELFINGKSQGRRSKDLTVRVDNSGDSVSLNSFARQRRYRLMWMDTRYEPGTLRVVAYDAEGNPVAERELRTAGKPYRIVLTPDRERIAADGKDLSFVTVSVVDRDGNLCPTADNEIRFRVTGNGLYRAGANGDPTSLESFQEPRMKLFSGMMTAIIASDGTPGEITVEATSPGLKRARLTLRGE